MLLELQAVDPLLRLMQGEDATVRRHATMALGVMCQHRKCDNVLLHSDTSQKEMCIFHVQFVGI